MLPHSLISIPVAIAVVLWLYRVIRSDVSHRNLHEHFLLNNRVDVINELVLPYVLMYVTLALQGQVNRASPNGVHSSLMPTFCHSCIHIAYITLHMYTSHVLYKHSNGKRASPANLKLVMGSLIGS